MYPDIEIESSLKRHFSSVWDYHIPIPRNISKKLIENRNRRVLVSINGNKPLQCAIMSGSDFDFVFLSRSVVEKLHLEEDQSLLLALKKDISEFGMDIPEELAVMLQQDAVAQSYFEKLTPGRQRALIQIVCRVKNPESRINKALAICHHLKESEGQLDFKILNEWIKYYNNQ